MGYDDILKIQRQEHFDLFYHILNRSLMKKGLEKDFILDAWNSSIREFAATHCPDGRRIKGIGGMEDGF